MRVLLLLLSAIFMLSSCSKEVQLMATSFSQEPVVVEEKSSLELRLSPIDLAQYVDVEAGVWQKAREVGLPKVFQKLIHKNIMITSADGAMYLSSVDGEYTQHGYIAHYFDAETGDMVQNFMLTARFMGDLALGGEIITIDEDRYIAGMFDIVYAILYETIPNSLPAYVAIARPLKELGSDFYRVTAMAEVQQIEGNEIALPLDKGGAHGTLCSLEIISSGREVEAGDKIFLMSVDITALEPQETEPVADELETIVIQPPQVDTIEEPQEQK